MPLHERAAAARARVACHGWAPHLREVLLAGDGGERVCGESGVCRGRRPAKRLLCTNVVW